MIRINKYLSLCGVTSRRGADTLISESRVSLNGEIVRQPGVMVDETGDVVKVDGTVITLVDRKLYILLNKPGQVMTTLHDPFKRKTVAHLLTKVSHRVYPVGRLDFDTKGVLLLTNDGDIAYRLTHPKYRIDRVYEAVVEGLFEQSSAKKIENGLKLNDGAIGRGEVSILRSDQETSQLRLVLREGRKREVKQLCRIVGHPVLHLTRVEFAGLTVGKLKRGEWRELTSSEVRRLKQLVEL